jgi:2-deoxy-D-gluconate 3-dehydrogenase
METEFTSAHRQDPDRYKAMQARMPVGRWGVPQDVAGAAVYLASDASAYVSGTVISIDGGWLSR